MSNQITLENIDNILTFLTLFSNQDCQSYDIQTEPLTLDPYNYSKEFNRFITALYTEKFVISFDWTNWQHEANLFVTTPELLNVADISTIQKLFTSHVRKERFCSGHLAPLIDNGHFLTILHRLEAIRKTILNNCR
jgi:O-acetyl-ADP-ribose deacetylase